MKWARARGVHVPLSLFSTFARLEYFFLPFLFILLHFALLLLLPLSLSFSPSPTLFSLIRLQTSSRLFISFFPFISLHYIFLLLSTSLPISYFPCPATFPFFLRTSHT
ncbi:MAG: hypothetical protein JOS17DRAFT_754799 [Linnemannia elongata]|nr:MAG: hypothetical protein JOS17DRAFT_754799 [Linnemannia elongata]